MIGNQDGHVSAWNKSRPKNISPAPRKNLRICKSMHIQNQLDMLPQDFGLV